MYRRIHFDVDSGKWIASLRGGWDSHEIDFTQLEPVGSPREIVCTPAWLETEVEAFFPDVYGCGKHAEYYIAQLGLYKPGSLDSTYIVKFFRRKTV